MSDFSEADNAEGQVTHSGQTLQRIELPALVRLHLFMILGQAPGQSEHQQDRMVGNFIRAVFIDGTDTDSCARRRFEINVTVTGRCDGDEAAALKLPNDEASEWRESGQNDVGIHAGRGEFILVAVANIFHQFDVCTEN